MRAAFSSSAHFPPSLLPPSFSPDRIPFITQSSPWGRWDDVDWVRQTLAEGGLLHDVHVDVLAHTWPMAGPAHYAQAFGAVVDIMARRVLGEAGEAALGGPEGVRARVRAFLEEDERYGNGAGQGWTLTWVSIVAWGRKPGGPAV